MLVSRGLCKGQVHVKSAHEPSGLSDRSLWFLSIARAENPGNSALIIFHGGDVVKFQNLCQREQDIFLRLTAGRCFADFTQATDSLIKRIQTRPH